MNLPLEEGPSTKLTGLVLGVATLSVAGIIIAADHGELTTQEAGLMMNGLLTIATLGYVFLTYNMVSQNRKDLEIRERYQKRPHVVERIESALLPLRYDIQRISRVLTDGETEWRGPNGIMIDGRQYRSYHEIRPGYRLHSIPGFTTHLDVDNAAIYDVYQAVDEYSEAYEQAYYRLQQLIMEELDDFQGDSDLVRRFALLALKLEDGQHGPTLWDSWRDEVIPLRDEMPELMSELEELRGEVSTACQTALRDIDTELNETLNEYEISDGDLDPESPPESEQLLTQELYRGVGWDESMGSFGENVEEESE